MRMRLPVAMSTNCRRPPTWVTHTGVVSYFFTFIVSRAHRLGNALLLATPLTLALSSAVSLAAPPGISLAASEQPIFPRRHFFPNHHPPAPPSEHYQPWLDCLFDQPVALQLRAVPSCLSRFSDPGIEPVASLLLCQPPQFPAVPPMAKRILFVSAEYRPRPIRWFTPGDATLMYVTHC